MFVSRDSPTSRGLFRHLHLGLMRLHAICCPHDDDRGSAGGVHPSATPSPLHSKTGCHCGPLRCLSRPQTAFCILRQKNGWRLLYYHTILACIDLFFLSTSGFFSTSWRNILRVSPSYPHWGSAPGPRWGTSVSQTPPASALPKPKSWIRRRPERRCRTSSRRRTYSPVHYELVKNMPL